MTKKELKYIVYFVGGGKIALFEDDVKFLKQEEFNSWQGSGEKKGEMPWIAINTENILYVVREDLDKKIKFKEEMLSFTLTDADKIKGTWTTT